jgi:hypothetical protein
MFLQELFQSVSNYLVVLSLIPATLIFGAVIAFAALYLLRPTWTWERKVLIWFTFFAVLLGLLWGMLVLFFPSWLFYIVLLVVSFLWMEYWNGYITEVVACNTKRALGLLAGTLAFMMLVAFPAEDKMHLELTLWMLALYACFLFPIFLRIEDAVFTMIKRHI